MSARRFGVILADPAWHFSTFSEKGAGRSPQAHYQTMSIEQLKALNVASLADENCALFMWTVSWLLPQALELGTAWGFTYKTVAFTWAKLVASRAGQAALLNIADDYHWHVGTGYWTRANPEFCLLFTKGSPKRRSRSIRALIVSALQEHSRKPEEAHRRIEQLIDCEQRLELFARRAVDNWTCLGNEIDGRSLEDSIAALAKSEQT